MTDPLLARQSAKSQTRVARTTTPLLGGVVMLAGTIVLLIILFMHNHVVEVQIDVHNLGPDVIDKMIISDGEGGQVEMVAIQPSHTITVDATMGLGEFWTVTLDCGNETNTSNIGRIGAQTIRAVSIQISDCGISHTHYE